MNPDILIAIFSSTVLSTLITVFTAQLQNRHQRQQNLAMRDQTVADRYYDELREDIDNLRRQLTDSDHRGNKWQEQYYQLYAKYQFVKAQFELASQRIDELTSSIEELKTIIQTKEHNRE